MRNVKQPINNEQVLETRLEVIVSEAILGGLSPVQVAFVLNKVATESRQKPTLSRKIKDVLDLHDLNTV